ncbi:MAG: hypothetical protein HDQ87_10205 [Clostridia bacterium]|nr:hypothetical protein [Clostridia bacterium]
MSNLALQYYEQGADEERAKLNKEFSKLKAEAEAAKQEAETRRLEVKRLKALRAVYEREASSLREKLL